MITKKKHAWSRTPGPWKFGQRNAPDSKACEKWCYRWRLGNTHGRIGVIDHISREDASLIVAAPAYAEAWAFVPDDIKQEIFDKLNKEGMGWIQSDIEKAERPMIKILLLGGPLSTPGATHEISDAVNVIAIIIGKTSYRYWPTGDVDHDTGLPIWRFSQRTPIPWPKTDKECWTNV